MDWREGPRAHESEVKNAASKNNHEPQSSGSLGEWRRKRRVGEGAGKMKQVVRNARGNTRKRQPAVIFIARFAAGTQEVEDSEDCRVLNKVKVQHSSHRRKIKRLLGLGAVWVLEWRGS